MSLTKILKSINGNSFKLIGFLFIAALLSWLYGCQSKTSSILCPGEKITRGELEAEIAYYNASFQRRIAELNAQDQLKKLLLNQASIITTTGEFNPIGLINSLISIGAVGIAIDSKRKLSNATKKTTG